MKFSIADFCNGDVLSSQTENRWSVIGLAPKALLKSQPGATPQESGLGNESRLQRYILGHAISLGLYPGVAMNAAPLARNTNAVIDRHYSGT